MKTIFRELRNLATEKEIMRMRLEDLERELYSVKRVKDKYRVGLDRYIDRNHKIESEMAVLQATLEDKEQTFREMKEKIDSLAGLEYKVAYRRYVEGKSLEEIAKELGYSYSHVKRVSAGLNKRCQLDF